VEIRQEVGPENFFLFGMTVEDVARVRREGYRPGPIVAGNPELREIMELIGSGHFSGGDRELFRPLVENLTQQDPFLVMADYAAYVACHDYIDGVWRDPDDWTRRAILNTAGSGKFSSDRAIREYCENIWRVAPLPASRAAP
jgi:starch phosphorylase